MAKAAEPAGVKIKVTRTPSDGYWSHTWMKKPFFGTEWNFRPVANMIMTVLLKSDGPWNESGWKNERFDKLISEVRYTLDKAKRQEMYCEMQRLVSQNAGNIIPSFNDNIDAATSKVHGRLDPRRPFTGLFWDDVWLET